LEKGIGLREGRIFAAKGFPPKKFLTPFFLILFRVPLYFLPYFPLNLFFTGKGSFLSLGPTKFNLTPL